MTKKNLLEEGCAIVSGGRMASRAHVQEKKPEKKMFEGHGMGEGQSAQEKLLQCQGNEKGPQMWKAPLPLPHPRMHKNKIKE